MKKLYILPNLVTTGNMFCGFISIVFSIEFNFEMAAWASIVAAVFDLMDGRVARMVNVTSSFGTEYDSLCDLVSFGLAPALLVYLWALEPYGRIGWVAAFMFLICGALRLARFNVGVPSVPKGYFQGLPIPAAAALLTTFVIYVEHSGNSNWRVIQYISFGLLISAALLMVSSLRFPSMKDVGLRSRKNPVVFLLALVIFGGIVWAPEIALLAVVSGYVSLGILSNLFRFIVPSKTVAVAGR